jgi:hypothetical protein
MKGRAKLARRALVFVLAMCVTGALAAGAFAATLHVSAKPKPIHSGGTLTLALSGSVKASELKVGVPRSGTVLVYIQRGTASCKSTATAEHGVAGKPVVVGRSLSGHFQHTSKFKPVTRLGSYRVCGYLYAGFQRAKLLKRATTTFKVVH